MSNRLVQATRPKSPLTKSQLEDSIKRIESLLIEENFPEAILSIYSCAENLENEDKQYSFNEKARPALDFLVEKSKVNCPWQLSAFLDLINYTRTTFDKLAPQHTIIINEFISDDFINLRKSEKMKIEVLLLLHREYCAKLKIPCDEEKLTSELYNTLDTYLKKIPKKSKDKIIYHNAIDDLDHQAYLRIIKIKFGEKFIEYCGQPGLGSIKIIGDLCVKAPKVFNHVRELLRSLEENDLPQAILAINKLGRYIRLQKNGIVIAKQLEELLAGTFILSEEVTINLYAISNAYKIKIDRGAKLNDGMVGISLFCKLLPDTKLNSIECRSKTELANKFIEKVFIQNFQTRNKLVADIERMKKLYRVLAYQFKEQCDKEFEADLQKKLDSYDKKQATAVGRNDPDEYYDIYIRYSQACLKIVKESSGEKDKLPLTRLEKILTENIRKPARVQNFCKALNSESYKPYYSLRLIVFAIGFLATLGGFLGLGLLFCDADSFFKRKKIALLDVAIIKPEPLEKSKSLVLS